MIEERERRYVDPVNRNLDIILGIIGVILIVAFCYLYYVYNQNELTKEYFKINDVTNETWVNKINDVEFKVTDSKLKLSIDGSEVIEETEYDFNPRTGEFKYKVNGNWVEEKLYLRSISSNAITIWYNYAELHLEKEIEVK